MKGVLIILLTLLVSGAIHGQPIKNLVQNGSFEKIRRGLPDKWFIPAYGNEKENITFYVEKGGAFSGNYFVTIEIKKPDDGRLIQFVKVNPNRTYKFSCQVKAEGIRKKGKGAHISILNAPVSSRDIKDTGGKWEHVEFFGRTGPEQHEVAAAVRLGGPGAFNTGKASFDDFRIEEAKSLPRGIEVVKLYKDKSEVPVSKKETSPKTEPVTGITFLLIGFMLLFMGIYYLLLKQYKLPFLSVTQPGKESQAAFFFLLSAAFILRIILAPVIEGHPSDIACFKGWAVMAADKGLTDFYLTDSFVDYPPGYIYILYLIGLLQKFFSLSYDSAVFLILIKSPAIIADMITSLVIFRLAKKGLGFAAASSLSLLYALNPAVIFDSTIYGQVDSVLTLLVLTSLIFLYQEKLKLASVMFTIAVLVKPQALIFSPVMLFAFIQNIRRKGSIKTFCFSAFFALVTFIVMILPFSIKQKPSWIFILYKETLSSYPFASLNAFNLFALFGGNWVEETETFFVFSYREWSFIFIITLVVFSAFLFFKSKERSGIFFTAMFIMAGVYILCSKMHERYLFPVIILTIMSYVYTKDRRFLFLLTGFTFTLLVNVALLLNFVVNKGIFSVPAQNFPLKLISFANVCLLLYTIKLGIDIYLKNKNDR